LKIVADPHKTSRMNELFVDRLIAGIEQKRAPICIGIDPMIDAFPDDLQPDDQRNLEACVDEIYEFCSGVLLAVAPVTPIVKFQIAYFEKYLWEGVQAYYELIREAKDLGLLVIGDVKRGDIGATSEAYAAAHLSEIEFTGAEDAAAPDAITLNPFLGADTLEPFVKVCRDEGKGIFVLVRTSTPGSKDLQDVLTHDGRTFSELVADTLNPIAQSPAMMGVNGYSNLGAVVGATQPHTMQSMRQRIPSSIFLLPGYGTQGATAEMTRAAFDDKGRGAIVSASRSILYAKGDDWRQAVEDAVMAMRDDLAFVGRA
jgi:orotidine-5'-phosphate decarboxylase